MQDLVLAVNDLLAAFDHLAVKHDVYKPESLAEGHTHTHARTHARTHTHMHTCIQTYTRAQTCTRACALVGRAHANERAARD